MKEMLTTRKVLKVASLNMSGRQLLKASQALHNKSTKNNFDRELTRKSNGRERNKEVSKS